MNITHRRLFGTTLLLFAALAALTFLPAAAWAGAIVVDTTAAVAPGSCTLASAITAAQTGANVEGCVWSGEATISLSEATYLVAGELPDVTGAVTILSEVAATIENSTFSANDASWGGALYQRAHSATVTFATFKDNTASAVAGGTTFYVDTGASLTLGRSALVDDSLEDLCWGTVSSAGDNAATDTSCALTAAGDQQGIAILLSDLVDHGGPTEVHVPICDGFAGGVCQSPLLDRFACDDFPGTSPSRDQRDLYRQVSLPSPHGYPETGSSCDVGAYESGCQTVYWFNPSVRQEQVVRLHREQISGSAELLDNGACYAHELDFDEALSNCSLTWEIYGGFGFLDITDVIFLRDDCEVDCFTDPELCAQECDTAAPAGWFEAAQHPSGGFRYDVPSCADPSEMAPYVIEYQDLQTLDFHYWDPRVYPEPPE